MGVGFLTALAVDNGGTIWPLATDVARRVRIVRANFSVGRVTVDHRVHVASGHPPKQIGWPQGFERFSTLPIRLSDDPYAKTLGFKHSPNHGHAKAWMVHIGITCHDDHIATVPSQEIHLGTAHGQKGGDTKPLGPVLLVRSQRLGSSVEKRDVCQGVHKFNPQV